MLPSSGHNLKIWTGGTQGIIMSHGGTFGELDNLTGMMRIKAGSVNLANRFGNYNFINCAANGSVDLYYDAQNHTTPKLATSATGVTIDGTAVATGADINGDLDVDGHTNLDNLSVAGVSTFSDAATFSGTVTHNSTTSLNDDVTFTGASYNVLWDKSDNALEFHDNTKATFGTDVDLSIYHDGSDSYIVEGGTGSLYIRGADVELSLIHI